MLATPGLACDYDTATRFIDAPPAPAVCTVGELRCTQSLERCESTGFGPNWAVLDDCSARGQVCAPTLLACTPCLPNARGCAGHDVVICDASGQVQSQVETCDDTQGEACRGGLCVNLCGRAKAERSNVGCEYWAVDLDNAVISTQSNAAAQQFGVVVSNAQSDVPAEVTIEQDDTLPGEDNDPIVVARATLPPLSLATFNLGPREVDGSPRGEFNTGTHTALTRSAFRVRSSMPVVAYQFNPLENVGVFSNDASLLKPVESITVDSGGVAPQYVVLGWPQTIASTDNPQTNFNPSGPVDLRAFLTIVGTQANTTVRITPRARILAGGPVAESSVQGVLPGEPFEVTLDAFDVLNLETDDFNADFTGSIVASDAPVVVFSGSEASDAPSFNTLAARKCCADHLEEQLDPLRTAGRRFVAAVSPNRSAAVKRAGGSLGISDQTEYFRVIATSVDGARVKTTLGEHGSQFELSTRGSFVDISARRHFILESDKPVMLSSVSPSQADAHVPDGLPGGDPSFLIVPPVEQFRSRYVFLTPDKYNFDFVRIVSAPGTTIRFDRKPLHELGCETAPADGWTAEQRGSDTPPFEVHTCQLSFPVIQASVTTSVMLDPGVQNDGVHIVEATQPVGVFVNGDDFFVSYAYAAGTDLRLIVPR